MKRWRNEQELRELVIRDLYMPALMMDVYAVRVEPFGLMTRASNP